MEKKIVSDEDMNPGNGHRAQEMKNQVSRRSFLGAMGLGVGAAALGMHQLSCSSPKALSAVKSAPPPISTSPDLAAIPGFEKLAANSSAEWIPISDRKIRIGLVGYGLCEFAAHFSFQHHPNLEVVAVSDLIPERCNQLAQATRCSTTYPSLEELIKHPGLEAIFIGTDAPSHGKHAIAALKRGLHVACAVPAVYGSLEEAEQLYRAVKSSGKLYMLFETAAYHRDVFAMREIYKAGGFGKIVYAEGEYYHYMREPLPGYNNWRDGLIPQWYPTHSNAYYVCVTGGSFTHVSCLGIPSKIPQFLPQNNVYKNPFGTEIALMRTSEGGMARMAVSWDTPGSGGEIGRVRGERGTFYGAYQGEETQLPNVQRPVLPPNVEPGFHDGSHGYLCAEFVEAILQERQPLINIAMALNLTVPGIVAHQSALRDGEWLEVPQYKL